ncbi:MAG: histidine kinase [Lachnospiraceae bacterium]|nr:histidine kinase [Lachnospiraceae bacterium]
MKTNKPLSVQTKLLILYSISSTFIILVNLVLFFSINERSEELSRAYETNVLIGELADSLDKIQSSMTDYLNTKSTDSIENYYNYEQEYRDYLQEITDSSITGEYGTGLTVSGANRILFEDIKNLSETYLSVTSDTVSSKRGRVVEKYNTSYEEAQELYGYINSYIYSLNNEQFRYNTANYSYLLDSLHYLEMTTIVVLIGVTVVNIILTAFITKNIMDPVRERELMMETHLKDAQLKYLEAQINPHFLFNTLNAGAQLAMLEDSEKTAEYIQNVAAFYRYKIKRNEKDTTLADEIGLVDNYIYILNVRFSGEIHFKKEIDEGCTGIAVPGMILQPIVENAVNYGVRNIEREKIIELSVRKKEERIEIEVRDNGAGISREKIEEIFSGTLSENADEKTEIDSNGVGLNNVISRLRLFYKTEDVLHIYSDGEDRGTTVSLYIPVTAGEG